MTLEPTERIFYQTRAAQIAVQSLNRIVDEQIIGMIVARPGFGKTHTINYWRHKRGPGFHHVWIEADVLTSCRPILNALAGALGLGGQRYNLWDMKVAITEALAKDPVTVIIDEADLLTVRTFELTRSIWDRVSELRGLDGERGFPLALFGTPHLRTMLERDDLERLRRRTFHKAELPGLNLKETETVLGKWQVKVDEDGLQELHRLSQGSFGWLNVIVPIAQKLAAKDSRVVTGAIARATTKYVVGLPEEN
jgi:DNA transposition AAA+ family ATPase